MNAGTECFAGLNSREYEDEERRKMVRTHEKSHPGGSTTGRNKEIREKMGSDEERMKIPQEMKRGKRRREKKREKKERSS